MPLAKVIQPTLTDEPLISCSFLPLVPCKGDLLANFYWNLETLGAGDEMKYMHPPRTATKLG